MSKSEMKVGDLVKFKHPDFHEAYGVGVITGPPHNHGSNRMPYFDIPVYFKDEIIRAREEELEIVNESR